MRENLYLAIARHREKTGERQGQIGLKCGILESRLCHIVHGRIEPKPEEQAALSRVLGVPEDVLFGDSLKLPIAATK